MTRTAHLTRRQGATLPTDLDLHDVVAVATPRAVEVWLEQTADPRARADELAELSDAQVRTLIGLLAPDSAADLLGTLDPHAAAEILHVVPPAVAAGLVDSTDPDEAAELLRVLPDGERAAVLAAMPVARSAVVRGLLAWPEESAAAHMNPEVGTVRPTMTVREAVDALRAQPDAATDSGEVYVTSDDRALLGALTFRDLVLAAPDVLVAALMRDEVVTVGPLVDQERAADLLRRHHLAALPVVDGGRLLGVLTGDDVADIVEEEATEDAVRQGGATPMDVPYLRASPLLLWRKRIGWLLVLFVTATITSSVLQHYEGELETVTALMFFVPLLIGAGGNAGTQITATVIRAMATGSVRLRDAGRVVRKEAVTGLMVAATIALVGLLRAYTQGVGGEVALTVAVSAGAIILWSSLVASVLPLLLRKVGLDPAVGSGPLITTVVDGTGLIIYFTVARLLISALGA
ncbi:magnesium transporter [Cellulomonas triticagri]|uniref:Magnesium transporter MgtE n=1 Tax=Cellulomonas triticagri TaxID=2483352 RepID=A0A3M2ISD0_9CELL|nr:magnesium transporter [Cellulomonas triticagri]RMI04847.1 magnesium transporter [Cellulomonas triticagri]